LFCFHKAPLRFWLLAKDIEETHPLLFFLQSIHYNSRVKEDKMKLNCMIFGECRWHIVFI